MKVQSMDSPRGNAVPNQFELTDDKGTRFFQSYQSIIAKIDTAGNITLDRKTWDYSTTTGKYRNLFLGMTKKETEKRIKDGSIKLANLN